MTTKNNNEREAIEQIRSNQTETLDLLQILAAGDTSDDLADIRLRQAEILECLDEILTESRKDELSKNDDSQA